MTLDQLRAELAYCRRCGATMAAADLQSKIAHLMPADGTEHPRRGTQIGQGLYQEGNE